MSLLTAGQLGGLLTIIRMAGFFGFGARVKLKFHFPGFNFDLQTVFGRRQGARPAFVVGAVGVVGQVEIYEQGVVANFIRF